MKNLKKGMLIVFTCLILSLTACTKNVESFKVKFDTNGGSKVETEIVEEGKSATKPVSPKKDGYIFDGWYTDKELTKEYDFKTEVGKDVTLYAKWVENTCGVICSKGYILTSNCKCIKDDSVITTTTKNSSDETTTKKNGTTKKTTTTTTKKVTEPKVTKVEIPYSNVELTQGETIKLEVNTLPSDAKAKSTTWTSSNSKVAVVDNNGLVTSIAPGTAVITVNVDGVKTTCIIVVNKEYKTMWLPVKDSAIGQYTLYITDDEGNTYSGKVKLTTIDDQEVTEDIPSEGKVYVKSIIKDAKVMSTSKEVK